MWVGGGDSSAGGTAVPHIHCPLVEKGSSPNHNPTLTNSSSCVQSLGRLLVSCYEQSIQANLIYHTVQVRTEVIKVMAPILSKLLESAQMLSTRSKQWPTS